MTFQSFLTEAAVRNEDISDRLKRQRYENSRPAMNTFVSRETKKIKENE